MKGNINSQKAALTYLADVSAKRAGRQGFTMPMIIAIIALVLVVAGVGYVATRTAPQSADTAQTPADEKASPEGAVDEADETMVKPDGAIEKKEEELTMKKEDGAMMANYVGTTLAGTSAPLLDFTKVDYDKAVASGKLVLLYFYADWCPTCRAEFPKMQAAFDKLSTDAVIGFRVNYKDSATDPDETALARQFGVAYQHTKVFVRGGVQVSKYPDSWEEARYLKEINDRL
jgi:thiol-disulfide isomerase/thioredoxin